MLCAEMGLESPVGKEGAMRERKEKTQPLGVCTNGDSNSNYMVRAPFTDPQAQGPQTGGPE